MGEVAHQGLLCVSFHTIQGQQPGLSWPSSRFVPCSPFLQFARIVSVPEQSVRVAGALLRLAQSKSLPGEACRALCRNGGLHCLPDCTTNCAAAPAGEHVGHGCHHSMSFATASAALHYAGAAVQQDLSPWSVMSPRSQGADGEEKCTFWEQEVLETLQHGLETQEAMGE